MGERRSWLVSWRELREQSIEPDEALTVLADARRDLLGDYMQDPEAHTPEVWRARMGALIVDQFHALEAAAVAHALGSVAQGASLRAAAANIETNHATVSGWLRQLTAEERRDLGLPEA